MKTITYQLQSPNGIHARPAGLMVKLCSGYTSAIEIEVNGKKAQANKLFSLMSLGAHGGDVITVTAAGADEDAAMEAVSAFLAENL